MLELTKFLLLLKKRRLILIIVPALSVIITYFLVRNLPNTYSSQAQIATGIVDNTFQDVLDENSTSKQSDIVQQFSNLTEMMKMKKVINQVSYLLIIHDITSGRAFRTPSKALKRLSPEELKKVVDTYREKYRHTEGLNLFNKREKQLDDYLRSMNYDSESILKTLKINRTGDSDFLTVDFTSDNPELSAFVVNTLCTEFINYYSYIVKINQRKANNFLDTLLSRKSNALNAKVEELKDYKIKNRVLNLDEQASQLYAQILDYDDRKRQAIKNVDSYVGAINEIENKFSPRERKYLEASMTKINQNLITTKDELKDLYDRYIQSGFEEQYKHSVDSLQNILSAQINRATDQYVYNPLATKQDLVQKRIQLEIDLDMARYSIGPLEKEQAALNGQFDKLVPHEAVVQSLERDIDVASKEYLDILDKYNQSSMESGLNVKLNLVQKAMPGTAQPSKKMLLVIISGVVSLAFCLFILFILFYLDNSITSAKELANKTMIPVLGGLNLINRKSIDLKSIWNESANDPELQTVKDHLRALRFEIGRVLKGKILVITSFCPAEGKTFMTVSLSFAMKMVNKKILIIDGNFANPEITRTSHPDVYIEDFFHGKSHINGNHSESEVSVIGNKGNDLSLFEIADQTMIKRKLEELSSAFDLIIIETSALATTTQPKEWILLGDTVISVFESGRSIPEARKPLLNYLQAPESNFLGWVFNKEDSTITSKKAK